MKKTDSASAFGIHLNTRRFSSDGFTLLEVLLAVTASAAVIVILFAALRLGHRSEEKGLEQEETSQRMRILADRLSWLIGGAYPYIVEKQEGKKLFFDGTPESMGFVTTAVDAYSEELADRPGLKWVRIFADGEGLKFNEKMFYDENVFEESGGKEYLFDGRVGEIEFEYLYVDEDKKAETWAGYWRPDERETLPWAVKVSITLEEGEKKIEVPPFIAAIRAGHGLLIPVEK